jgi:hypothetical protein
VTDNEMDREAKTINGLVKGFAAKVGIGVDISKMEIDLTTLPDETLLKFHQHYQRQLLRVLEEMARRLNLHGY